MVKILSGEIGLGAKNYKCKAHTWAQSKDLTISGLAVRLRPRLKAEQRGGFKLIVGSLLRADKRPSVGATSITHPAQLLTFRIFLFKPVELYQTTINSSYCDGVLKH